MNRHMPCLVAIALLLPAGWTRVGEASGLSVDVWTDRGNDAVYRPGEQIQVKTRPSEDAYVLVYEIDAEGYVHKLFPYDRSGGLLEGRRSFSINDDRPDAELVAQGPVGQGYIVAIASLEPFEALPWYLRPVDKQAEELGYEGGPSDEEEGVTQEGRIVGDPFVAMERIRRRVLQSPDDSRSFATAYTGYYVHHEVRYPRYLCYDCHRPHEWQWWDGFDPYYARCSVFDLRVNYGWAWGPNYWFGSVPYFVYVYRDDCPPRYRHPGRRSWSSWDGWQRWQSLWGGSLRRFKTPAPVGYVPPSKYDGEFRRPGSRDLPPGFIGTTPKERLGRRIGLPTGRQIGDYGTGRGAGNYRPRSDRPRLPGAPRDGRGIDVRRGPERPIPESETPRSTQPGGRRERDVTPEPSRREDVAPPPEPRREPGNVDRAPRQEPPARAPDPPRTPQPGSSSDRHDGAPRVRRP